MGITEGGTDFSKQRLIHLSCQSLADSAIEQLVL